MINKQIHVFMVYIKSNFKIIIFKIKTLLKIQKLLKKKIKKKICLVSIREISIVKVLNRTSILK